MKKSFLFVFLCIFAFAILLNFSACESQKAEKNEINSSASLNLKQDEMRLKSVDCGADKSAQNAECNENLSANSNTNSNVNSNTNSKCKFKRKFARNAKFRAKFKPKFSSKAYHKSLCHRAATYSTA